MPKKVMDTEREAWHQPLSLEETENIPIQEPIHHAMVEWEKGILSKIHIENIDKLDDLMWEDIQDWLRTVIKTRDYEKYQIFEKLRMQERGLLPLEDLNA